MACNFFKMKKKILILFVLLFISCGSIDTVKFTVYEAGKKNIYSTKLPSGYIITKHNGEIFEEIHYNYSDGSIFYYTNDYQSGGNVNKEKIKKFGEKILIKTAVNDTLDINGINEFGREWREKKRSNLILGYINASTEMANKFDKAIENISKK